MDSSQSMPSMMMYTFLRKGDHCSRSGLKIVPISGGHTNCWPRSTSSFHPGAKPSWPLSDGVELLLVTFDPSWTRKGAHGRLDIGEDVDQSSLSSSALPGQSCVLGNKQDLKKLEGIFGEAVFRSFLLLSAFTLNCLLYRGIPDRFRCQPAECRWPLDLPSAKVSWVVLSWSPAASWKLLEPVEMFLVLAF